jgi:hypothetical protein
MARPSLPTTWKQRNPEKVKAQKAAWYERHKEVIAGKQAERYRNNPEPKDERTKAWKDANPLLMRLHGQNRRSRIAGDKLSQGIVDQLWALQRGKCACCKQPLGSDFHLDHVLPLARGGTNTDDNVQLLRSLCNRQKHAKHPIDFMQSRGFLL